SSCLHCRQVDRVHLVPQHLPRAAQVVGDHLSRGSWGVLQVPRVYPSGVVPAEEVVGEQPAVVADGAAPCDLAAAGLAVGEVVHAASLSVSSTGSRFASMIANSGGGLTLFPTMRT